MKLWLVLLVPASCVALLGMVADGLVMRPAAAAVLASAAAVAASAAVPKDNLGGRAMKLSSAPPWAVVLDALITLVLGAAYIACALWAVGVLP